MTNNLDDVALDELRSNQTNQRATEVERIPNYEKKIPEEFTDPISRKEQEGCARAQIE